MVGVRTAHTLVVLPLHWGCCRRSSARCNVLFVVRATRRLRWRVVQRGRRTTQPQTMKRSRQPPTTHDDEADQIALPPEESVVLPAQPGAVGLDGGGAGGDGAPAVAGGGAGAYGMSAGAEAFSEPETRALIRIRRDMEETFASAAKRKGVRSLYATLAARLYEEGRGEVRNRVGFGFGLCCDRAGCVCVGLSLSFGKYCSSKRMPAVVCCSNSTVASADSRASDAEVGQSHGNVQGSLLLFVVCCCW